MSTKSKPFEKLVGQNHIKKQLQFYIDSHKVDGVSPFIMFNGAKGLGKTHFAKEYAKALKKPLLEINCSTIKNNEQFFEQIFMPVIMDNEVTILFDESHELPKDLVMAFLTVFNIEGAKRKDFQWRENNFEFNFEKQTYIFATTEPDKLFAPFKDRLTIVDFKPYHTQELAEIMKLNVDWVKFEDDVMDEISLTLRGNARSAVKRAKEIGMYCNAKNVSTFGRKAWNELKDTLDIKPFGLSNTEVEILNTLWTRGDCTLGMLSAATGLSRTAIQRDSEIHLLRMGFLKIEGNRKITESGIRALATI
jgi:Holliday junction resolvasome RuvABC ATP-dependent DNA helicase subunit